MRAAVLLAVLAGCAAKHETRPGDDAVTTSGSAYGRGGYEIDGATVDRKEETVSRRSAGKANLDEDYWQNAPAGPPPPPPPPPPQGEPAVAQQAPAESRMVHYSGWMTLRVTKIQDELDRLAKLAADRGGRVESLSSQAIVIRVPVETYRATWAEIRKDGDVLDQSETAEDVTEAFTAVDLRVKTATATRDRLVALLAKAESENDKILLLQQLQRVTEELDGLQRDLRTLRSLADFSRITIQLVPKGAFVAGGATGPVIAGFDWIELLSPFQHAAGYDPRRLALPVPDGMVALSPKGPFTAESPEGAVLWTGRVVNDPRADAAFWIAAVVDRVKQDFASSTVSAVGAWTCARMVDGSEAPYTWDVCVRADSDDRKLDLAQAFYPDAAAFERYHAGIEAALGAGGDGVSDGGAP